MSKITFKLNLGVWGQRMLAAAYLAGQVFFHVLKGKIHRRNTVEQMAIVGPESLLIVLLTASFVGMVFTIQVARELVSFGTANMVGGMLAITLTRELGPVLTAVVVAGRVGSAFAAEIGTMKVTEQIDALYMLKTDPVDYLVIPRVIACAVMMPILTLLCLIAAILGGLIVAVNMYDISQSIYISSVHTFLTLWDLCSGLLKSMVFGVLVAVIGTSWGLTTTGGAKGVGQSTTTAVVTALISIFIFNFFLSWAMFQGIGGAMKQSF
ncbi:MAG: MlaE family lipid ABC transporter permease subunit [Okeania sp. SIO1H4]|nr:MULTISPECIES: MlaE family lipid ABC transporter permease subunit [Okeania]NES76580.1 MlaE family lipid ABC transporter permease subunit [Okeania sp. SIO1H4]NET20227.1 MlaE family lipid ABC transporter permease subunit [Okeania sp. SIO1H5]NET95349.1 MlaE family lipid ABC transporter permease subunit [Okeania sp. SIO1H2]RQH14468.1 MlaE family lipid ABC transporter permease subunit [Okeania hirsuta]